MNSELDQQLAELLTLCDAAPAGATVLFAGTGQGAAALDFYNAARELVPVLLVELARQELGRNPPSPDVLRLALGTTPDVLRRLAEDACHRDCFSCYQHSQCPRIDCDDENQDEWPCRQDAAAALALAGRLAALLTPAAALPH